MAFRTLCMFMYSLAAIGPCHAKRVQSQSLTLQGNSSGQEYGLSGSSLAWPTSWPWNEISLEDKKVLGEGSYGIAVRYYTTCNPAHAIVAKEVKQITGMAMHERVEKCEQAVVETSVQMEMAEKDRAVRVFDLTPKNCDELTLQDNEETYIMMACARGDCAPNPSKEPDVALMLDIAKQLSLGLDELHTLGYLHRDIKPENLLFESKRDITDWEDCAPGECRFTLADYGLACKRAISKWGRKTTCTEASAGTPVFFPPEVATSILEGARTADYSRGMDYWALGITLFQMFFDDIFPTNIDSIPSLGGVLHYFMQLGADGDVDWWKKDRHGVLLDERATKDPDMKLFRDILSKLLIPSRFLRTDAYMNDMAALLQQINTSSVQIPSVCVDFCNRCTDGEECRADHLLWKCVQPPREAIHVSVTVIIDNIYGTWNYDDYKGVRRSLEIFEIGGQTFIRGTKLFSEEIVFAELRPEEDSDWFVAELWAASLRFRLSNCGVGIITHTPSGSSGFSEIIKAHAANKIQIPFTLDGSNTLGNELRDLKVLVAKKFNMDVEQAAFFYDDVDSPIEDIQTLLNNDELYLSPPLRHALISGPAVGKPLAAAIADAKRTKELTFPYIDVAEEIMKAWPAQSWPTARSALRSRKIVDQETLARKLRPLVEEAKTYFQVPVPLVAWSKLLEDLSAPLEVRMEEERKKAMSSTQERCRKVGYRHCAQEVRMHMDDSVDYVKVEYTVDGESPTKLKFFNDGRIQKTRGDDVVKHKAVMEAPTLPGSIPLTITLCKNKYAKSCMWNVASMFVKSESRCKTIGEKISYTLRGDGVTSLRREKISDRLQKRFQVSSFPDVAFLIWDGDYRFES